ncbi:hypothetical protein CIPAW_05G217300 [Carya illinoinensis]|uniref:Uncharacterized protein n=1 Tax=Carya illinoinensis TaxID=32201 RepID=A0A8T1QN83_CARIL|nr:hypothetical protein CIPAW_05G217300 [Carya illinoinensis]
MAVGGGFYGVWHWVLAGLWWIAFPEVVRKCGCVARSPCVRTGHGGGHDVRFDLKLCCASSNRGSSSIFWI